MRLWVKKKPTAMSADIGRVIAEDWRTEYSDFGTVEGRLETIQDKGTLLIYVRDPLFSSSVRCYFDEDLLPQVFECFRKRVEITGTIHYRRNGTPTSIDAASITPFLMILNCQAQTMFAGFSVPERERRKNILGRRRLSRLASRRTWQGRVRQGHDPES